MILLFSHKLSDKQYSQAKQKYNIDEFIYLPKKLQNIWSNIPADVESIYEFTEPIKRFLLQSASEGDIILVQGDFGIVYNIVNFCKQHKLIPVYATTQRNTTEYIKDNKNIKESIFEFRRFREYE